MPVTTIILVIFSLKHSLINSSIIWFAFSREKPCRSIFFVKSICLSSFTDKSGEKIIINSEYVKKNLGELVKDTDLSKFIL